MAAAASPAEVASLAEMTRIEALAAGERPVLEALKTGDAAPTTKQVKRTSIRAFQQAKRPAEFDSYLNPGKNWTSSYGDLS